MIRRTRNALIVFFLLSMLTHIFTTESRSQPAPDSLRFEYAVKCLCGSGEPPIMAAGKYFTAVNVHNPSNKRVNFKYKVAVAFPGAKGGPVPTAKDFHNATLEPDQALEIDCKDIMSAAHSERGFLKGFTVLESPVELDVVGVYSAAGKTGMVESLELERVPGRHLMNASNGLADLTLFSACWHGDSVIVCVINQGKADAPASMTTVKFSNGSTLQLPTPPIAAGKTFCFPPLAAPANCFRPDCFVTVTVDSNDQVQESDETNNTSKEICIG